MKPYTLVPIIPIPHPLENGHVRGMRWPTLLLLIAGCDASMVDAPVEIPEDLGFPIEIDSGVIEPSDAGVLEDAELSDVGFDDAGLPSDSGVTPDSGVPSEWSAISAILAGRCRGCHNNNPRPRVDEWDRIVGVRSNVVPLALVEPGSANASWLYAKISATHLAVCGRVGVAQNRCGRRMPSTGAALPAEAVERIRVWIEAGATRD
jgi:hypothetical protein